MTNNPPLAAGIAGPAPTEIGMSSETKIVTGLLARRLRSQADKSDNPERTIELEYLAVEIECGNFSEDCARRFAAAKRDRRVTGYVFHAQLEIEDALGTGRPFGTVDEFLEAILNRAGLVEEDMG